MRLRSDGGVTGLVVAPDGRKPSAWENQLLDGRDSSFGVAVESGLRVAWTTGSGLRPYVAARWTSILGYDAFVRSSSGGPSLSLGVQVSSARAATR